MTIAQQTPTKKRVGERGISSAVDILQLMQTDSPVFHLSATFDILNVNEVVEEYFGYSRIHLIGKQINEIIFESDNPITQSLRHILSIESTPHAGKTALPSKLFRWQLTEVFDTTGKSAVFTLTGYDITSYTSKRLSSEKTAHSLKEVLSAIPHAICWKTKELEYLGCNKQFAELVGLDDPEDIVGKTDFHLAWQHYGNMHRKQDLLVMQNGENVLNQERSILLKGNREFVMSVSQSPLYDDDGNAIGIINMFVDITQRKLTERKMLEDKQRSEAVNQAKSDFLANISHDLRTPLNNILVSAQFLNLSEHTQEQGEFISAIGTAGETLLHFVEAILDFGKLESGKIDLHNEPFDLRQVSEDVLSIMSHKAIEKGIELMMSYDEFVPRQLIGDSFCLHRMLINLIDNAIKFTDEGHVLIKFSSLRRFDEKTYIRIAIEDTGIGIEAGKTDYIFERFTKLTPAFKGTHSSTGLGLPVVKELVDQMKGEIQVKGKPGKGSVFTITLPFEKQDVRLQYSRWYRHYSNLRVLIIDDSQLRGQIILKQIATEGSTIIPSKQAEEELLRTSQQNCPYHIIIIDDEITDTSPEKLAGKINSDPQLKNSLLIYFSKPCDLETTTRIKNLGFFEHLIKPVKPSELINRLANAWACWVASEKGHDYLLKSFQPHVLLLENDPLNQKILKLILNEFGCICEVMSAYSEEKMAAHEAYDLVLLGLDKLKSEDCYSVIKSIRQYEDKSNPLPIVGIRSQIDTQRERKLENLAIKSILTKPIDHKELKQTLLENLFGSNLSK